MNIQQNMSLMEKLSILADAAKYDVACTSSGVDRRGKKDGIRNSVAAGICHSFAADGRCISCWRGWPVPERRNGAAGGWASPRRWQRRPGRRGWCGARGEASGCSLP